MERHDDIRRPAEAVARRGIALARALERPAQRVDHHVAHEVNAVVGHSLGPQVVDRVPGGHEEQPGKPVGEHAVDLLGHSPVPAAEARLYVPHPDAELRRHQGGGEGGVHIAVHQDDVRPIRLQHRLEALQHRGRLDRVRARTHAQMMVRRR